MDNNHEAIVISGSDYRRLMVLLVVLSVFIPLIAGLGVSWGDWPNAPGQSLLWVQRWPS